VPLQLITAPETEPLTVAQAKAWCRIDTNADEALVTALIRAARTFAENRLRRSLLTQTWCLTIDSFPGPSLMGVPWGVEYTLPGHAIILERPPIQSITAVKYIGLDGIQYTLPGFIPGTGLPGSSNTFVDLTYGGTVRVDDPLRLTPPFGQIWPIMMPQIGSVTVTYNTGYGDDVDGTLEGAPFGSPVPEDILTWMKLRIAALYENREEVVVGTRVTVQELPYIDSLLDYWKVEIP